MGIPLGILFRAHELAEKITEAKHSVLIWRDVPKGDREKISRETKFWGSI